MGIGQFGIEKKLLNVPPNGAEGYPLEGRGLDQVGDLLEDLPLRGPGERAAG